ncbi:MAG: PEGA domain-containing protein, partial [Myxococcales bacterium]|nr:PEGA domain-containing protein [Myxococcales bacterium]
MGSPEAAPLVPQDEKTGLVDGAKVTTAIMAERPPQLGPQAPPAPPMPPAAPVGLSGGAPPPPPPPPMVSPLMAPAAPLVALDPRLVPPVPPPRPSIVGRVVALVFVALLSAGGGVAYVKRARWLPALGIGVAPEPQGTASSPPASASVPPPVEPPIAFGSSAPPVASAPEAGPASDASARDAAALPKDASAEVTKDAESPAPAPSASSASALVAKASTTILSTRSASPNHRIFFDGRVVGETPASVEVPCGKHTVQLGSAGTSRTLELPCGQEIVVGDR